MLGLCCDKTYCAMENHDNRDDNGDNNGNKDINDNGTAASGLGSDVPIFNPITTLCSCLGLAEEDWATTTTTLRLRIPMYPCVGIYLTYKYPIIVIVNICAMNCCMQKLVFRTYTAKT